MAKARNKSGSLILTGIIFIIIGLVFVIPSIVKLSKINSGDLLNLNEASKEDFQAGEYCEITLKYDYGCYAEYQQTTYYVIKRTTQKYYLVDAGKDDEYYLGVRIPAGDADDLENLAYEDETNTDTITYKGILRAQSGDAQKYYEEFIHDMYTYYYGLSDSDLGSVDEITLPYYLDIVSPGSMAGSIIVGAIFAVIGLIMIVIDILRKKKTAAYNASAAAPANYNAGSYDASTFGNYNGNDMSSGNPYQNPYGGDPMAQQNAPYAPGNSSTSEQAQPYQDPFYQAPDSNDQTTTSSGSFNLKQ